MPEDMADDIAAAAVAAGTKPAGVEPTPAKYAQDLARSLTFRENILITLSSVTPASSVFIIIPAAITGVGGASALAFAIAAVIGVTVALCYAELSSAFPITGGEYAFVARTLGKPYGFALFGMSLVSGVFILGVISSGASQYLGAVTSSLSGSWVGILVIVLASVVACFQIRANAWITATFLVLELAALAVLTVLGVLHLNQPVSTLWTARSIGGGGVLEAASAGLVVSYTATALFAYNGYGTAVYYAEETKQATKTIGRAIMWSLLITVVAEFVPLVAVLLGTPSMTKLVGSDDPMTYFMQARGGHVLTDIVSIGIAIAIINAVLAIVLQVGRLVYSSARDRSWPDAINRPLGSVHPRLKTPIVATALVGVVGALLLWLVSFNILLIVTDSSLLITYTLVALAALVGRVRGSTSRAPYKMPAWPAVPVILILAMVVVTYENVKADWVPVVVSVALFLIGVPYYYLYLRPRSGERWTLPDPADEEIA
jgi:amino acid transporter